jgi:hypothetical protein
MKLSKLVKLKARKLSVGTQSKESELAQLTFMILCHKKVKYKGKVVPVLN